MHLGQRAAVVALESTQFFRIERRFSQELTRMGLDVVTVQREKFLRQRRRPAGVVVLEGIVELSAQAAGRQALQGHRESSEIALERIGGIRIEHQARATGRRALHLHRRGFARETSVDQRQRTRTLRDADFGSAEGPARPRGHVHAQPQAPRLAGRERQ
jgi:hypothetical protein